MSNLKEILISIKDGTVSSIKFAYNKLSNVLAVEEEDSFTNEVDYSISPSSSFDSVSNVSEELNQINSDHSVNG
ncbi:MAG: hypothetical protein J0H68_09785 [Sphingobacteriia bacterium]|nr:hypothetical protein [Sphingobacteriia bacterium]